VIAEALRAFEEIVLDAPPDHRRITDHMRVTIAKYERSWLVLVLVGNGTDGLTKQLAAMSEQLDMFNKKP
jgi:hypothetical protein